MSIKFHLFHLLNLFCSKDSLINIINYFFTRLYSYLLQKFRCISRVNNFKSFFCLHVFMIEHRKGSKCFHK